MARSVKPFIVKPGRVISGTYYSCPDDSLPDQAGLPTIPLERVGLNGEYDYYGLAKRVQADLRHHFGHEVVSRLDIQQRGSAILLSGKISQWSLAERLAQAILSVEGATLVELRHLQIVDSGLSSEVIVHLTSLQA